MRCNRQSLVAGESAPQGKASSDPFQTSGRAAPYQCRYRRSPCPTLTSGLRWPQTRMSITCAPGTGFRQGIWENRCIGFHDTLRANQTTLLLPTVLQRIPPIYRWAFVPGSPS